MKLTSLKIDVESSENGVWFEYYGDIEFRISRLGNTKYQLKYAAELNAAFEKFGQSIPQIEYERIATVSLATCLTDWKGILDDDESTLEFSKEKAIEILLNPEYCDIKDFIALKANLRANFKKLSDEEVKKQ